MLAAFLAPAALQAQENAGDPEWDAKLHQSLAQMAADLESRITLRRVSSRIFRVTDYGAVANGSTVNTTAIQRAIDDCSAQGGGAVLVDGGDFVTGGIRLKSGVTLEVSRGSRLLGSDNLADYAPFQPARQSPVEQREKGALALIFAADCDRIGIRGDGTIDGRGSVDRFPSRSPSGAALKRPFVIRFVECRDVSVSHVHLRDSASWMQNYVACDRVLLDGVDVQNLANVNNDGFDIDGCRDVLVRNCVVDSEDDGLCFKGISARDMQNVLVENCKIYSACNAMKFGTESEGGFRNVLIRNVELGGAPPAMPVSSVRPMRDSISGISWESVDGGQIENVLVEDAAINHATAPFFLRLGNRGRAYAAPAAGAPGQISHVTFEHIVGSGNGELGSVVSGIPGAPICDVIWRDIRLGAAGGAAAVDAVRSSLPEKEKSYPEAWMFGRVSPAYGFWLRHVRRALFDDVTITPAQPDARQAIVCGDDTSGIVVASHPNGRP